MAARLKPIRIHFEDRGQECLWWELSPVEGRRHLCVVSRASAQGWLWQDGYVQRASIGVGLRPVLLYRVLFKGQASHCIPVVRLEAIDSPKQSAARASNAAQRAKKIAARKLLEVA